MEGTEVTEETDKQEKRSNGDTWGAQARAPVRRASRSDARKRIDRRKRTRDDSGRARFRGSILFRVSAGCAGRPVEPQPPFLSYSC